jgi:phenylacetate-CoA ligase
MLKAVLYRSIQFLLGNAISRKEIRALQENSNSRCEFSLREILRYAGEHVPYYKNLKSNLSLNLQEVPPLSKATLRAFFEMFKSDEHVKIKHHLNSSGGSTGAPQTFLQDEFYSHWNSLTKAYYFKEFLGFEEYRIPKILLWGSERDLFGETHWLQKLINVLTQTVVFNSFKMSPEDWERCVETLNRMRPVMIRGYAHSLYEFAQYIEENNKKVWKPKVIYSSAETLWPFMREEIERAFGVKVYDFYGSREVGPIAGECHKGKRHIFTFNNWVEVVDAQGKEVQPGEEGRLLITNLHNRVMPLIRYEIGDTAMKGKGGCSCGNPLPILEKITGRTSDHFETMDGSTVHGEYFTHLFYFQEWVEEFQVRQESKEHVHIFIVFKKPYESVPQKQRKEIESKIHLVMGPGCTVTWERVAQIPRTPQGKLLFTYSLIHGRS